MKTNKRLKAIKKKYKTIKKLLKSIKKQSIKTKDEMKKLIIIIGSLFALIACNVTRNVTTRSEFYQKGDTAVMIQTKTTETYDGTIKR